MSLEKFDQKQSQESRLEKYLESSKWSQKSEKNQVLTLGFCHNSSYVLPSPELFLVSET